MTLPHREGIHAEYVGGVAIVTPAAAIEAGLPGLNVVEASGLTSPPVRDHRIPDVAVFAEFEDVSVTDQTPILVAEILSRSTRAEDTLRTSGEYAAAGISQYWILDRDQRTITVLRNDGGVWQIDLELDDERPVGTVVVGEHGSVVLDLPALLDR